LLLQAFCSTRSERQLVERIDYDLLFRWFVGLGIEDDVWDAASFTKNRDRLLGGGDEPVPRGSAVAKQGQEVVVERPLLGRRHIVEAWASPKSFRPKDGSGELPGPERNSACDFRGERRKNDIHASTIDPDARLYRKGPGAKRRGCVSSATR
jgi:hypothetical protein